MPQPRPRWLASAKLRSQGEAPLKGLGELREGFTEDGLLLVLLTVIKVEGAQPIGSCFQGSSEVILLKPPTIFSRSCIVGSINDKQGLRPLREN